MNLKRILVPVAGAVVIAAAWRAYGWQGVGIAAGGIVMWMLLHFTRMMHVLKQAGERPMGWCGSAVMLNAKLKPGVNLLHVMALTRAMGELRSPEGEQPEIFRWTDNGGSHVTCEFRDGKLVQWTMFRPPEEAQDAPAGGDGAAASGGNTPAAH